MTERGSLLTFFSPEPLRSVELPKSGRAKR